MTNRLEDVFRLNVWLVALNVDDDLGIVATPPDDFRDAIRAAAMIARHFASTAESFDLGGDFLAVGRHDQVR